MTQEQIENELKDVCKALTDHAFDRMHTPSHVRTFAMTREVAQVICHSIAGDKPPKTVAIHDVMSRLRSIEGSDGGPCQVWVSPGAASVLVVAYALRERLVAFKTATVKPSLHDRLMHAVSEQGCAMVPMLPSEAADLRQALIYSDAHRGPDVVTNRILDMTANLSARLGEAKARIDPGPLMLSNEEASQIWAALYHTPDDPHGSKSGAVRVYLGIDPTGHHLWRNQSTGVIETDDQPPPIYPAEPGVKLPPAAEDQAMLAGALAERDRARDLLERALGLIEALIEDRGQER